MSTISSSILFAFFLLIAAKLIAVPVYLLNRFFLKKYYKPIRIRTVYIWFLLLTVVVKSAWLYFLIPRHPFDSRDLLSRHQYLVSHVLTSQFGPHSIPQIVGHRFQIEWAIGTLSMTGLATTNLYYRKLITLSEAKAVLKKLIERMMQDDLREYEFLYWGWDALDAVDVPGAFQDRGSIGYLGHLNLLLSCYRLLGGEDYSSLQLRISDALARRVRRAPSLFVETFPGQIYVPDNLVVIASLALNDLATEQERYQSIIKSWVSTVREKMIDSRSDLFVPWVDAASGYPIEGVRGSYAAWNMIFLPHIDLPLAKQQWEAIKKRMITKPISGFAAMREYYPGEGGMGDIDSGSVLFGMSPSGTGFIMAAAAYFEELDLLMGLMRSAELVGYSISNSDGRSYLLAPIIGDAIVLATRTSTHYSVSSTTPKAKH